MLDVPVWSASSACGIRTLCVSVAYDSTPELDANLRRERQSQRALI